MSIVGEVDSKGHLELWEDPEAWIRNNPPFRLALVTSLVLWLHEEEIGEFIGEFTQLIRLTFRGCRSLKCVPANIGQLVSLTHLELYFCGNIKFIPDSIVNLSNLTSLTLCCCKSLVELPENIGQLPSLTHLDLFGCENIKFLPDSIVNLSNLTSLTLFGCKSLVELPENIGQLASLTHLNLYRCENIKFLPDSIVNLSNLASLTLSYCKSLVELPENIGQLASLTHLMLDFCKKIKSLPNSMTNLYNLDTLDIQNCESLTQLPVDLKVSILNLDIYCNLNLPTALRNLKYLDVTAFDCSHLSFENLKDADSLQHLCIPGDTHQNNIIKLPASLNQLVNLQVLSIDAVYYRYYYLIRFVELPANLNGLAKLCVVDIEGSLIKCLPWSITALGSLRLLMLPFDFRLHTLPSELKDQITISVNRRHVRKTWKELKEEISFSEVRLKMARGVPQHSSIISPSGYLRLKGDPGPWIQSNFDSLMSVQILELEDLKMSKDYSIGNMTQLNQLTHLYISGCRCFPDNYFATNTRLRHLSLEKCDKKSLIHSLGNDSLSKLSNLETLHIDLNGLKLPANINFPASIKCLSLLHGNMKSLHDSLAKLPNLKTIDLYVFRNLNLFLTNLYLAKVRLIDCSIASLPTCLLHLEILCNKSYTCKVGQLKCINKLVNLKTLSISCHEMVFVPMMKTLSNLETLQFKDCFSLKDLPSYLGELVSLRNLDISGTRIRSLPGSIMELCNLQHLILPRCFNLENLPRNFKGVLIIDNTHETYYKRMGYFNSRFQTSTETSDGNDTAQGCIQTQGVIPGESCNEDDNIVPVAGVDETVRAEQTSANDIPIFFNMEHSEPITSEQGAISQVYKDSQFDGRKGLINENSQYVACSLQNQFPSSGNDDFVTIFDDDFTTEQIFTTVTSENDRLPTNFNADKTLDGYRLKYNCSKMSPLIDLINTEHLDISLCVCSEELLATLKNSLSLGHLAIKDCKQQHHVKEFPANLNVFANLQTLFIQCSYIESLPSFIGLQNLQKLYIGGDHASRLKEFPADLDKLDKLLAVDIHDTKIKCLPWSVMMLQKLRFLFLPLDFRLETLPCQLNESIVITVDCLHIRKSWKELRREMRPSSLHGADMEVPQNSLILSPSGYLRLEDPGDWIQKNSNLCELVRSLELELADNIERIGDFIGELPNLTCLYISGSTCLNLKHLPSTSMALRHLSLQNCNIELLPDSFGKLSNLESLCLDTNLPANLDLLANLRCLYLQYGREQSLIDSMAKLTNLKALHLFECELDSLPETLNLDELKFSDCSIRSLPTGLGLCRHLEILHSKETCKNVKCDVTSLSLKQFVNVEKLSITCHSMEWLPNIEILQNLQDLQLKDCSSLVALPENLGNLVKLCTLDISGTRIKSLPDSITKLHNLQHLSLPKCFQQDCSHKYPRQEFQVSVDDTFELYFNDMSYDVNDYESSLETSSDEQTLPHNLHAIQDRGDPCYNKGETSNPSGESSHAIQNTITTKTEQGIALVCVTKEIDCGEINHHALQSEQNHIPQSNNVRVKMNRSDITLEMLQPFWSNGTRLEDAAEQLGVSRSTLKRSIKELGVEWPRKGKKQQPDAKKRKHNNKAPFESDCSQQNLVNLGSSAAHAENVECIMGSDLHTFPNHISSNSIVVIDLIPDATMEAIRGNLMETIDSHQGAEVHLNGANERTLSETFDAMVIESHMDIQQQVQGHLEGALHTTESSGTIVVKATYKELSVRIVFSLTLPINQLIEEIGMKFQLELNKYRLLYQDADKEWMMLTSVEDLKYASNVAESWGTKFVRLSVIDYVV